jgi:hypothetical protein
MLKLHLNFSHCYGIKKLIHQLPFHNSSVAIYAPNGFFKTSLAKTFKDAQENKPSKDSLFPHRQTVRSIQDESGSDLPPTNIHVIKSYDEEFGHTERTATLLVNNELRKEYEQLEEQVLSAKSVFLQALRNQSGSVKDLQTEISTSFGNRFWDVMMALRNEVENANPLFADIPYDVIFDPKVQDFLNTPEVEGAIQDYVRRYNELIGRSKYFKKENFNYHNAGALVKQLSDQGFFAANHSLLLKANENVEIESANQLQELIDTEKNELLNDKSLKSKLGKLDKSINKNAAVREFQTLLLEREYLLPLLSDIPELRKEIWKAYIFLHKELYLNLLQVHEATCNRRKEIEVQAANEKTQWERVIDLFNKRFHVPFSLKAKNKVSMCLGLESIPTLDFIFSDGDESVDVDKAELLPILSTGEKKALYILNILFEIEARRQAEQETLFVIDDIADSFDYKNKYAILRYLKEISKEKYFKLILLSHNFDFFRAVIHSGIAYPSSCFMAIKEADSIRLAPAQGINNIFIDEWKPKFFNCMRTRFACITFIRNILEYTMGSDHPDYLTLTSLLHWKEDSNSITNGDLDTIFNTCFGTNNNSSSPEEKVIPKIFAEADSCLAADDGINFENKIVMAIAIRLKAERFMVETIDDKEATSVIHNRQTSKLFGKYKKKYPLNEPELAVLEDVLLMTPENIHLNSFMFEPILDMSDVHLRRLYHSVSTLIGRMPALIG